MLKQASMIIHGLKQIFFKKWSEGPHTEIVQSGNYMVFAVIPFITTPNKMIEGDTCTQPDGVKGPEIDNC